MEQDDPERIVVRGVPAIERRRLTEPGQRRLDLSVAEVGLRALVRGPRLKPIDRARLRGAACYRQQGHQEGAHAGAVP